MKIQIEVEPVILPGNLSDETYYGFKVTGLDTTRGGCLWKIVFRSPNATYPGNDAMREFINEKARDRDELIHTLQIIHANAAESAEWIRARIDNVLGGETK